MSRHLKPLLKLTFLFTLFYVLLGFRGSLNAAGDDKGIKCALEIREAEGWICAR